MLEAAAAFRISLASFFRMTPALAAAPCSDQPDFPRVGLLA
jgi:hypothetical protein